MRKELRMARRLAKERKKYIESLKPEKETKSRKEEEKELIEIVLQRKQAIRDLINKIPVFRKKSLKFFKRGDTTVILYQLNVRNTWCVIKPRMQRSDFYNRLLMNKIIADEKTREFFPEYKTWTF